MSLLPWMLQLRQFCVLLGRINWKNFRTPPINHIRRCRRRDRIFIMSSKLLQWWRLGGVFWWSLGAWSLWWSWSSLSQDRSRCRGGLGTGPGGRCWREFQSCSLHLISISSPSICLESEPRPRHGTTIHSRDAKTRSLLRLAFGALALLGILAVLPLLDIVRLVS